MISATGPTVAAKSYGWAYDARGTTENETLTADPLEIEDGSDLGDVLLLLGTGLGIVVAAMLVLWIFGVVGKMLQIRD